MMIRMTSTAIAVMLANIALAGGPPDLVVGAGRSDVFDSKVEIMAKSDADGQNAQGRFSLRQGVGDFSISGEVTCLHVMDYWAVAGGLVAESSDPNLIGWTFFQATQDFGEGADDIDESQTVLLPPALGVLPSACQEIQLDPTIPIDRGNYEVKDR